MKKGVILKCGRLIYRVLGLSANQRRVRVFKKQVLDAYEGNKLIFDIIVSEKPKMISRLGVIEANSLLNFVEISHWRTNFIGKLNAVLSGSCSAWNEDVKYSLQMNAGFFPRTDEMVEEFCRYFLLQLQSMDTMAVWRFVPGENYFFQNYCPTATPISPEALEPYFFENPWSIALKGKKVLVIHPFSETIKRQYKRRELLFKNQNILPEFDLVTIKAVQSIAGNKTNFADWFDALSYMQKQIDQVVFDVALIGAGSYGLPLASYVKGKGKIAIHTGGATQILFGIKGRRWDNHPYISKLYNNYWVRPDFCEVVSEFQKVENGCYW